MKRIGKKMLVIMMTFALAMSMAASVFAYTAQEDDGERSKQDDATNNIVYSSIGMFRILDEGTNVISTGDSVKVVIKINPLASGKYDRMALTEYPKGNADEIKAELDAAAIKADRIEESQGPNGRTGEITTLYSPVFTFTIPATDVGKKIPFVYSQDGKWMTKAYYLIVLTEEEATARRDAIFYPESEDVNVYYDKDGQEAVLGMFRVMKNQSSVVGNADGKLTVTITNKPMSTKYNKLAFVTGDSTEEEKEAAAISGKVAGPDEDNKYQTTFTFDIDPEDVEKDMYISFNSTSSKGVTSWGTNSSYRIRVHNTEAVKAELENANKLKNAAIAKIKSGIVKSFKAKAGKKKVTFTWKKNTTFAGYQLKYKAGKKSKTLNIKSAKTVKKIVKKLKKGTKATAQIRGYKTIAEKTYYGKWAKSKTVKVK